jgi:ribosome-associated protein
MENRSAWKELITPDNPELVWSSIRASGPGGQNVNKVSSACQLRFNIHASKYLDDEQKSRLVHLAGYRVTTEGVLVIEAKRYRTQERNRMDAYLRLIRLIESAMQPEKQRLRTRRPHSSVIERRRQKSRRSQVKVMRSTHSLEREKE